jgi:hypothetical protein
VKIWNAFKLNEVRIFCFRQRQQFLDQLLKKNSLYIRVLISLWLSKRILFLQDSAVPHKAAITHQKLAHLHFEVLKHPASLRGLSPQANYTDRATAAVVVVVPTFAGRGCYVVSATDSHGR